MKNHKHKLLTISLLAGSTAVAIHIINKCINASALIKNMLHKEPENSEIYHWKFGDIYYTKSGNGSPLLLIHDLTVSSNGQEWCTLIDNLSKKHTVYCLDLLGCGRSQKPQMTYTNFLYVQLLTDFTKEIIKERTDVVATGLSASFSIMTCLNNEEVFGKLMLINPTDLSVLNQIPTKQSKIAKFLLEAPLVGTLIYNILANKSSTELYFTETAFYNPFHVNSTITDTYYESAHTEKGRGKYLQASISGHYIYNNIAHALKKVNNSIFIIGGEKEEGIDATMALYTSLNPSIESEKVAKSKHLPQLENPEKVLELMNIFF